MNERAAIRLLRSLITHEGGILPSGRMDLGWCCNEHALIASLAFTLAGKKTFICDGKLLIITKGSSDVFEVFPHKFLIDDFRGVFDSSVTHDSIEGISTYRQQRVPDTIVLAGASAPAADALLRKLNASAFARCLCYAAEKPLVFQPTILQMSSDTPFGIWLTDRFGSQSGLWAKAAWFVHEALDGRPPALGDTRDAMWDVIARSLNRDDAVISAMSTLRQP